MSQLAAFGYPDNNNNFNGYNNYYPDDLPNSGSSSGGQMMNDIQIDAPPAPFKPRVRKCKYDSSSSRISSLKN